MSSERVEAVGYVKKGNQHLHAAISVSPAAWVEKYTSMRFGAHVLVDKLLGEIAAAHLAAKRGEYSIGAFLQRGFPPTLLLAGYTLEVGFKALYVARVRPTAAERAFHNHELCGLAKAAKVPLGPAEQRLCEVLSAVTIHLGRYPVPKRQHDAVASHGYGEVTLEEFKKLDQRIAGLLAEA
ncbi:MAG: hypothetical protein ACREO4_16275 [Lysobacter sp.]